jgi:hypothetical protein
VEERILSRTNEHVKRSPLALGSYYQRLIMELSEIGWQNVVDLNYDLTEVTLRTLSVSFIFFFRVCLKRLL